MTQSKIFRWVKGLALLSVLILSTGYARWRWLQAPADAPKFETATLAVGGLVQVVTASGQLNPVLKVEVGSQISGNIQKLLADFNSPVKEGELIAQIDPGTYEANFIQAEGNLASAKAALELARINEARTKSLRADKLNPQADYDKALADLHQAEAGVKIAEGVLKKAQVDLSRCKIYAPIDGVVISRNVNVGQTVAASLSAPTLFIIANDLSKMQIEADVAEADIGQIEVDHDVDFTVDALPGQTFHGKVRQIRNAPKADQNVVTYDTVIDVSNASLKLKPGMTANVSIIVARRNNVLKIPNAAFRFHPPRNAEVKKMEMTEASDKSAKKSDDPKRKKDKRKAERTAYVWQSGALQAVKVKPGITDGRETEVIEGLNPGEAVVVDMTVSRERPGLASRLLSVVKGRE